MIRIVLLVAALAACRNNAILLAHKIDPLATCDATSTAWFAADSRGHDEALCISGKEIWGCTDYPEPKCTVLGQRRTPAEAP